VTGDEGEPLMLGICSTPELINMTGWKIHHFHRKCMEIYLRIDEGFSMEHLVVEMFQAV